jgi:Site-specific recombinase XerD
VRRKNKQRALDELKDIKATVAKYGDVATSSVTLKAWLTYWMEEIVPGTVTPNTYSGRANHVNSYLIPLLGYRRLDKLTARDVRDFHKRMAALPSNKKLRALPEKEWPAGYDTLGASALSGAHSTLNAALKAALLEHKITINAAEIAGPPKGDPTAAQGALSVSETAKLLAYLATHPQGAMWTTYILTGARRGEVLGLEADRARGGTLDMSWQLQSFTARSIEAARKDYEIRHVRGTLYLCRPKSSAGWRILPLVDPLKSVLELHMQGRGPGLLFVDAQGEAEHPSAISRKWRELLADAKIDADVKLHGVRHTVVDLLYDAGVPEQVIQQIVGHSTAKMTRSYKTRVNQGEAQKALESLGSFIAKS